MISWTKEQRIALNREGEERIGLEWETRAEQRNHSVKLV
jgi:hypothetical protein